MVTGSLPLLLSGDVLDLNAWHLSVRGLVSKCDRNQSSAAKSRPRQRNSGYSALPSESQCVLDDEPDSDDDGTPVRMAKGVFVLKPSYYHLMWVHKDSHIVERSAAVIWFTDALAQ
ncbi:hypothetical protein HPB50_022697 [Hyalomma asiaticum]|uniref:Uncharacterized protein n=1 Tax=Hyalomma asiaticum TaxID=266040 RepID=A0ACB7TBX3_HYAAI|nr:hypothetical protein HPB50_022697 [Hyalomma asiaticum]